MPTALLCVTGMRDEEDERRVESTLHAVPGVFDAVANREDACAEVDYEDDEATLDELIAAVRRAGFDARLGG